MWKGAISFGLVNIPIQLYTATEEKQIRFSQLHRPCRTRIRYMKFCPTCETEVSQKDLVRGLEYEPDLMVLIEDEDLESLPLPTMRTVEILSFVNLAEVDPIYFGRTYYIEPQERAEKAYALLHRALGDSGRIAIAKVALRQKESLATIRLYGHLLALELMLYPDEIRSAEPLRGVRQAPEPTERELAVARQLIESLSVPFEPAAYKDEYREALWRRIEEKAQGQTDVVAPKRPAAASAEDLLASLEASLAQVRKDGEREPVSPLPLQ